MSWSPERVEILKALWANGLSAGRIADQLRGVTRNAVIGKVHRLGLPGRVRRSANRSSVRRPRRPRTRTRPNRLPRSSAPTHAAPTRLAARPIEDIAVPVPLGVTLMKLTDSMCKWPIGDPAHDNFHFCGHRPFGGHSYCEYHARVAYQPR